MLYSNRGEKMIFATNNEGKLKELQDIFNNQNIQCLKDLNINVDVPETGNSFYENALIKAKAIYEITKIPTIADDSGLIFEELNDWPGIYTHRVEDEAKKLNLTRNEYLLKKGCELKNKKIKAVCNLVYYDGKEILSSVGEMKGTITDKEYPGNGFGFDSIFRLDDGRIVSSLTSSEKNKLSHRFNACNNLKKILIEKGIL